MKIFTSIKKRAKNFLLLLVMLLSSSWAWGQTVAYQTGFESSEDFVSNTSYKNENMIYKGPTGQQWGIIYGNTTTTGKISGSQCLNLRVYETQPVTPYTETNFSIANAISLEFKALYVTTANSLLVQHSIDNGESWSVGESFVLSKSSNTYCYNVTGDNDNVRFRISIQNVSVSKNSYVVIDDIVIYANASTNECFTPVLSSEGAKFIETTLVTATCATDGATIHYTTNGETPTEASPVFPVGGLTISETTTINAIAVKDGYEDSEVVSATYTKLNVSVCALVAEKNGAYYAMSDDIENNRLNAEEVNAVNGKVIKETWSKTISWYVDQSAGTIISLNGKYVTFTGTSTKLKLGDSEYNWQWNAETGYWTVITEPTRMLALYSGKTPYYFKAYKEDPSVAPAITMPFVDGYVRTVTPEKFGTICLPCAVAAEDIAGATFYSIAGKRTEAGVVKTLVLTEETTLQAGVPYLFCATADKLVVAYNGAATTASTSNGLVGSLTGQDVAEDMYILTNNTIKQCGTGCTIGANRAYIGMAAVSEFGGALGVNQRMISLDGETAIDDVMNVTTDRVDVYTMSGVRVRHQVPVADATNGLSAGVYVVGTKKVVVK